MRPRAWVACGGIVVGGAAIACGPSYQAIYEGNARFEHCYALEENPQAPMPDKAACWRDWSERYTYGQTRDRIHYATARYVALSEARVVPTDEALMMAAPGETPRATTITAPTPTNAFAPPPKVLDFDESATTGRGFVGTPPDVPLIVDAGAPEPLVPVAAPLPGSSCTETCASGFQSCQGSACNADAASSKECRKCQTTYRACMRGCFK